MVFLISHSGADWALEQKVASQRALIGMLFKHRSAVLQRCINFARWIRAMAGSYASTKLNVLKSVPAALLITKRRAAEKTDCTIYI